MFEMFVCQSDFLLTLYGHGNYCGDEETKNIETVLFNFKPLYLQRLNPTSLFIIYYIVSLH